MRLVCLSATSIVVTTRHCCFPEHLVEPFRNAMNLDRWTFVCFGQDISEVMDTFNTSALQSRVECLDFAFGDFAVGRESNSAGGDEVGFDF